MQFPKRIEADDLDLWSKELRLTGPFVVSPDPFTHALRVYYLGDEGYTQLAEYSRGKGYWKLEGVFRQRMKKLGLE